MYTIGVSMNIEDLIHAYGTNNSRYPTVQHVLIFLSILISGTIGSICIIVQNRWGFAIGGISVVGVWKVLHYIFDKWLWRIRFLRRILLVPDLNGIWNVKGQTVRSEGKDVAYQWAGEIKNTQS